MENKPVFKRMFVWYLFAHEVMLLLLYWNRECKQQKHLAGLNKVNSPVFESEPVLVMTVFGCLIGTVWLHIYQCVKGGWLRFRTDASAWKIESLRCGSQSERLAVPGTCTSKWEAGWREKRRRGEMKIKRGTKDKGVCKKWKSKEKFLCWAIPAFNTVTDNTTWTSFSAV